MNDRVMTTAEVCDALRRGPEWLRKKRKDPSFPIQPCELGRGLYPADKVHEYLDRINGKEECGDNVDNIISARLQNENQNALSSS